MWRFLHNIPRALKNYHGPRASVGVYVDSDDKEQEATVKLEKEASKCVAKVSRQNSCCLFSKDTCARGRTILWRLVSQKNWGHTADDEREEQQGWWSCYQRDLLACLQRSDRLKETFAVGTSILWANNNGKRNQKSDLLYRVLFSFHQKDGLVHFSNLRSAASSRQWNQNVLAIKDAVGSAQDGVINQSKSETLDTALKEFEHMCTDYTAQNESLLALGAADKGDMSEAVKHFRVSCSMGNKTACFNLGLCYETGSGVTRNLDKAKHYYEVAALKGHNQAMYNLSLLYLNKDSLEAGNVDLEKGMKFMEMAARSGLAQAQTYMGIYHMDETGNSKTAAAYFKTAADQNDSEAQYFLALCHEHGLGLEVNECRAAHLYSVAASMGHDGAMFNLATFNENGLGGIPSDPATAFELYTKAAKLGNEDAKNRLEELRILKQKEEENTVLDQAKDKEHTLTFQTSTAHQNSINSSSSSPNLRLMNYSLSELFYQGVNSIWKTPDTGSQALFDPGGGGTSRVSFYMGGDSEKVNESSNITADKAQAVAGCQVGCDDDLHLYKFLKCNAFHKSNTTPNLQSMVACNI